MQDELRRLPDRREYVLARPSRYRGRLAIVFSGGGWTVERMRAETGLDALGEANGFAIAWGVTWRTRIGLEVLAWNAGAGCCGRAAQDGVDDVGYALDVLQDATRALGGAEACVVGASSGGIMAYTASAALGLDVGVVAGCRLHPLGAGVRVVHVHGDADTFVPWDGGMVKDGGGYACRPTMVELGESTGGVPMAIEPRREQVWTYRWSDRVTLHRRRYGGHTWSPDASGLIVDGLGLGAAASASARVA